LLISTFRLNYKKHKKKKKGYNKIGAVEALYTKKKSLKHFGSKNSKHSNISKSLLKRIEIEKQSLKDMR